MRYIALEEAFFIPELAERQPMTNDGVPQLPSRWNSAAAARFAARLPDFVEYRLPEMDEAGIDIQVLSLTVPGLQVDIEPEWPVATPVSSTTTRRKSWRRTRTASSALPSCRCKTARPRPRNWNAR